jgi:hypothetical protein
MMSVKTIPAQAARIPFARKKVRDVVQYWRKVQATMMIIPMISGTLG